MNLQHYIDVSLCRDEASLRGMLIQFAHERNFGRFAACLVGRSSVPNKPNDLFFLNNAPADFGSSTTDLGEANRDPVLKRLVRDSLPFIYDQSTYVEANAADLWERQAEFGYRCGISVALHLPNNQDFFFGIDSDQQLPDESHLVRLMGELQLMAVHAQEAARQIFLPVTSPHAPKLSPRELEILRWTMEGKSAWAIGEILGISEHTVNFHARNLFRKLEVSNKHQAVVKALGLGIL